MICKPWTPSIRAMVKTGVLQIAHIIGYGQQSMYRKSYTCRKESYCGIDDQNWIYHVLTMAHIPGDTSIEE